MTREEAIGALVAARLVFDFNGIDASEYTEAMKLALSALTPPTREQMERERDEAIKTIFQWVGCPECKWWDSADEWCEKYDREADSCGGCESPEWRGQTEE